MEQWRIVFEKASEQSDFISLTEYPQLMMETIATVAGQARRTEAFLLLYSQLIKENISSLSAAGILTPAKPC